MATAKAPSQTPRTAPRATPTPGIRAAAAVAATRETDRPERTARGAREAPERRPSHPCRISGRPLEDHRMEGHRTAGRRTAGHRTAALSTEKTREGVGLTEARVAKKGAAPGAPRSRAARGPARRVMMPHSSAAIRGITARVPARGETSSFGRNRNRNKSWTREGRSRGVRPFTPPSGPSLPWRMTGRPAGCRRPR